VRLRRRSGQPGGVPAPWVVGLGALVAAGLLEVAPRSWVGVAPVVVVEIGLALLAARWAVRAEWTPRHTLAPAAAGLLTYAWHSFPEQPVFPVAPAVDLIGNTVFTLGVLLLIGMAWRRTAAASTIVSSSTDR
jgi:hypothetical protein